LPLIFGTGFIAGGLIYWLGKPDERAEESSSGVFAYPVRAFNRLAGIFSSLEEPAFEKLLPEPVVDPNNPRPYTLVVDLDKFLVCHIWDVHSLLLVWCLLG